MSRQRVDPTTPDAPIVGACVTVEMAQVIARMARRRRRSRSAVVRELLAYAIGQIERAEAAAGDGDE